MQRRCTVGGKVGKPREGYIIFVVQPMVFRQCCSFCSLLIYLYLFSFVVLFSSALKFGFSCNCNLPGFFFSSFLYLPCIPWYYEGKKRRRCSSSPQAVSLSQQPPPLHHQPHRVGLSLGGVGDPSWQQEHLQTGET